MQRYVKRQISSVWVGQFISSHNHPRAPKFKKRTMAISETGLVPNVHDGQGEIDSPHFAHKDRLGRRASLRVKFRQRDDPWRK